MWVLCQKRSARKCNNGKNNLMLHTSVFNSNIGNWGTKQNIWFLTNMQNRGLRIQDLCLSHLVSPFPIVLV